MTNARKTFLGMISLAAALAAIWRQSPAKAIPSQPQNIVVENDVAVPMRDGVVLRADVLRPQGPGPFPVLVYRTPYGKRAAQESYTTFRRAVERGYAVVVQDVRGRYASEGEFRPYENEGKDGYDTIEWAARQPWSNGAVGTFGLSYPGAVQWLAAVERPPHLKAMVPAMTFSTPRNFFYSGGVPDLSWIGWIWNNILPDVRVRKNVAGPKTYEEARAEWARIRERVPRFLPIADLPELKELAPYYAEWWRHAPNDPWWDWCELRDKYSRVQPAVLNLSGWYDEAYGPEGATTNFLGLLAARKGKEARTQLLIGPWRHGVEETAETRVGERDFGPQAAINYDEVVLAWMDRYVKGLRTGWDVKQKPVRVFVMGRNEWTKSDTWPRPGTVRTSFYLTAPPGGTNTGGLEQSAPAAADSSSRFVSDPQNPVVDPQSAYSGPQDYSGLAKRGDVLVYETTPLKRDLEVTGPITAEIFLSCDCADTDLWVKLLDVSPDGKALSLMSPGLDVLRASFREPGKRSLLTPGQVYRLGLKNLLTSNVFLKGHRIRIQVSASLFPNFSRNLHSGELETTSAKMQKATIRIHHDKQRPSRLILPVVSQQR